MDIKQKIELRHHLIPELSQSLNILSLPLLDIRALIEKELVGNPLLEELRPAKDTLNSSSLTSSPPFYPEAKFIGPDSGFRTGSIAKKISLQEALIRQLGMFTESDEDFAIGQEIIGNLDENGYLKVGMEEIAVILGVGVDKVEKILKLIQDFEPSGVGARTARECLLIQLRLANESDPLLIKIVNDHLEDVAKKNYSLISRALKEPPEKIGQLIKKILRLNPKPGCNFSLDEAQRVVPDIIIREKDDEELDIVINNEDIPDLGINQSYREILRQSQADPQTKEFLSNKLATAMELLRAISKRQTTLRKIVETVMEIQKEAVRQGLSYLKPLTFRQVAELVEMHESTVCRAVMNKYVYTSHGVVALKDFFPSRVHDENGQSVSSSHIKGAIKEIIDREDKKHPYSDSRITKILEQEKNIKVARRTVAKYREELKILSTAFRRER
jgi:RNA polymerase sigma-54 factor